MSLFAIGSYTRHKTNDVRGRGITIVNWNDDDSCFIVDEADEINNPTYLYWCSEDRILYSVSAGRKTDNTGLIGGAASYAVDEDGKLDWRSSMPGPGASACHLCVVPELNRLYTTSYSDGRLTSYTVADGRVNSVVGTRVYDGSGPNKLRQNSSHAHQVVSSPFGPHLYVCDLGSDVVWMHKWSNDADITDPADPIQQPEIALKTPAGTGPRHLAWDPLLPAVYLQCELQARLLVARVNPADGRMKILEEHDTAAADDMAVSAPAAVKMHPSKRTLAVSNRFDDTIAVFAIDRSTGQPVLTLVDRFPCGGKAPRDIEFDPSGSRLFIANQNSHMVTCRYFSGETGLPRSGWAPPLQTGSPVCIVMLDGPASD